MKSGFRFGVCDTVGRQSSVFRVWRGKKTSDIYVAVRSVAGIIKASLHQSGLWQVSFTSQYFHRNDTKPFLDGDRHFSMCPRPGEVMLGVTRAFTIYFPTSELGIAHSVSDKKAVYWLSAAEKDSWIAAELMLTSPNAPKTSWRSEDGAELPVIDHMTLPNGENLWLVCRVVPENVSILSKLTEIRIQIREDRSLSLKDADWDPHLSKERIVLMGKTGDGTNFFVDASLAGT